MLPLTILPPDQRRTIRMYVAYEMIKASGGIIITTLSVVAIALLMAKLILNFYFIQLVSDTTKLTKIARSYDTEIKQFNQYLAAISDMQQGYHPWHNDIAVIMQQFSAQVGITQATFRSHKKTMQVVLAGTAASREAILTFKDALEQLPNIATVDIPVNQLLKQTNVTFEATITLK